MIINDRTEARKYRFNKPRNHEETVSAIYEELSVTPLNDWGINPEQTVKGYLHAMLVHMKEGSQKELTRRKDEERSESFTLGLCGLLGLILVFVSANAKDNYEWWRTYSYFFFVLGTILTVMFVGASMEKSPLVARMLKLHSAKILCAFVFSAAIIYSSAQASGLLNSIFHIDGSNLPYARAILSAVIFLKMCTPFMFILAAFALVHILVVWRSTKDKDGLYEFPWNSAQFIIGSLIVAGNFWWVTHGAFGDEQIKPKAYKLAHYLDFNSNAYCLNPSEEESYLFFGQDQNKVLIDKKLELTESFEEFMKGTSIFGRITVPSDFKVFPCHPR